MDSGIIVVSGFTQPRYRKKSTGIFLIRDELAKRFFDRREYWLGTRIYNDFAKHDADEFVRLNINKSVLIAYSWANSHYLTDFAERFKEYGKDIDLVICIDPVPNKFGVLSKAIGALSPTDKTFKLPPNIKNAVGIRTVNKRNWMSPWGRSIEATDDRTNIINYMVFGSKRRLKKYKKDVHPQYSYVDKKVYHDTIDNNPRVISHVYRAICKFHLQRSV